MKINIVGIKQISFKDRDTGKEVEGQTVFFEVDDENVFGRATDHCFLSRRKMLEPIPNLPVWADLYYNKYGKADEIIISK